jgi:hypothetical protein
LLKFSSSSTGPAEKHTLKASEDREVREIFGPKREKGASGWRELYTEELHYLWSYFL